MSVLSYFLYYFSFTAEIVLASLFFVHFFERKRLWWLSMTLGIGLMCLVSCFWNPGFTREGLLGLTLKYVVFYLIVIVTLWCSFHCGIWGAIFCATMGYCIQHITYNTFTTIARFFSIPISLLDTNLRADLLHVLCFAVMYPILFLITGRGYLKNRDMMHRKFMENWSVIVFGAIFVTVATLLDNISLLLISENEIWEFAYLLNAYLIIVSICIINILLSAVREKKTQEELKSMKLLLHSQRRVYRNNKEMIDNINLKAHDLKHQLHALRGRMPEKQVEEMEHLVNLYDTAFHTGNEALDVVLAEKGACCVNRRILLTCLLNGGHIKSFSDTDIYSFFGNAIDNAIDAVGSLPEEKRVISITENVQADLMNIRIENYCVTDQIPFEDGMPMTKRDVRYHGFGTKSMRHIAEKYGGNLFFSHEGEKFVVNLILPTF